MLIEVISKIESESKFRKIEYEINMFFSQSYAEANKSDIEEYGKRISKLFIRDYLNKQNKNFDLVFITTKGSADLLSKHLGISRNSFIEIFEFIDNRGYIIEELKESEINKVLRKIFTIKPSKIYISLLNSCYNSIHEKSMKNILSVAGYKNVKISSSEI